MKGKIFRIGFAAIVLLTVLGIILFGVLEDVNKINKDENYQTEFNSIEKEYIESKKEINLYVDETLSYLNNDGGRGFLSEYINELLEDSGITVKIISDFEAADCWLMLITETVRAAGETINYTSPIFHETGKLYIHDGYDMSEYAEGVVVADRMSESNLNKITYENQKISWTFVKTNQEAAEYAKEHDVDFILGDKSAMTYAVGDSRDYVGIKENIYKLNTCIVTDKNNEILSDIINQCIYSKNRAMISYRMNEKWLDGNGPVYLENDYGDIYILLLIIFIAVLIVFFVYYLSNKNLYRELSDRMNKLAESKQELRSTFGSVGYCIAELGMQGNIIDINRAFYDFAAGNVVNRKIWEVMDFAEADREVIKNAVLDINKTGSLRNLEVKIKNKIWI